MTTCIPFINNRYQAQFENNRGMLDEMVKDIQEIREKHTTPEGFRKKVQEYIKDVGEEKILNQREQLRQIAKREHNLKRMRDPKFKGNYAEALHSFLRQTNYNAKGAGASVESVMTVYNRKYQTHLDQNFSEADVKVIISGALDREIIQHVASGGQIKVSEVAQRYGNAMKKLQDMIHADKRANGIEVGYIENYLINQRDIHSPEFFKSVSRDEYIELNMKNLDHEKTFKYISGDEEKRKYLGEVYDGFTQRIADKERVDFNNLPKSQDLIQSSIQRKNLQPRALHYTPEGLADMWARGSNKNLLESMVADSARASRDIALYDVLGPRGENEFNTLKQKALKELQEKRDAAAPADKAKFQKQIDRITSGGGSLKDLTSGYANEWAVINGTVDQVEKKWFSTINENFRALTSMDVLGNDMLSAFTDLGTGAVRLSVATGGGGLTSIAKQAEGLLRSIPPKQQKKVAHMMAIALESGMGNQLRVAGSSGPVSKGINKLNYLFQKLNPAAAQGRFHRVAATTMLGLDLHDASTRAFSELNPWQKQFVEKAGISEHDWKAFAAMKQDINGKGDHIISARHSSQISDEIAREAIAANKAADPFFLPQSPREYRAMMERKVGTLYDDFAADAAPNPGLRERAILMQGTKKGTVNGEIMRNVAMLKSFTLKQMSVMQKIYLSNPNGAGNIKHLSAQMAGLFTMGAAVLSLRAIRDNESMPDFTNADTIKRLITTSGAFGPMADFALAETGIGADPLTSFVAGPNIAYMGKLLGMGKKVVSGEFKQKDIGKAAKLLPGSNLFYLKAALNYHMFGAIQAALEDPEAERRKQKELRKQGRERLVQ